MPREVSISVAPNGARRTKGDHSALPIRIDEIADTARSCFDAGANTIHLHIREDDGRHSLDVGRYRETLSAIRQSAPKMAVQVTTEAAGIFDVKAQYHCLHQLRPACASVSVREMNRDPFTAGLLYGFVAEAGIKVQHICYDLQDVATLRQWQKAGIVSEASNSVLFVLGRYQPATAARPGDLDPFLNATHGWNPNWSVCAFGKEEAACLSYAMKRGGNVRTGFENNFHLPNGTLARDNTELVSLVRKAALCQGLSLRNHPEPVS